MDDYPKQYMISNIKKIILYSVCLVGLAVALHFALLGMGDTAPQQQINSAGGHATIADNDLGNENQSATQDQQISSAESHEVNANSNVAQGNQNVTQDITKTAFPLILLVVFIFYAVKFLMFGGV